MKAFTTFDKGEDISDVVTEIIQTWIQPFEPIKYNVSKVNPVSGVVLANDIELGNFFIDKVLDTLADMANHRWGVDGNGDLFWEARTAEIMKTIFVGYDFTSFMPRDNLQNVKNAIMVQRKKGKAEGGAGWEVAGLFNSPESVTQP